MKQFETLTFNETWPCKISILKIAPWASKISSKKFTHLVDIHTMLRQINAWCMGEYPGATSPLFLCLTYKSRITKKIFYQHEEWYITRIAKIGTLHRNLNKWWCIIFVLNDCISFVTNIIALPSNSSLWDFNETQRFRAHLILTFRLRNWKKFIQCNSVTTTIRSPWDMVIWVICWIAQIIGKTMIL